MDLKSVRQEIDCLDTKILKLLNERMEKAIISRKFKTDVEDKKREEILIKRIRSSAGGLINPDFCEQLFKEIISESKDLQKQNKILIGFQGESGAYSELAAKKWNKDYIPVSNNSFAEVFQGVKNGIFDYGIVPVENTLGGVVGQVNELLINTDLCVVGAVNLPIHHCLMTLPNTDYRDLKDVYSHPQALSQCRAFLERNKLNPLPYYDTAGSANMLMEKRLKASAVIAGRMAADLYNLEIVKENVEDLKINRTRFLVISRKPNKEEGEKISIHFTTAHKAGTLFGALEIFAKAEINLTRIESIPENPGYYVFFVDFTGSINDPKVTAVIEQLQSLTENFKVMGCYQEIVIGAD